MSTSPLSNQFTFYSNEESNSQNTCILYRHYISPRDDQDNDSTTPLFTNFSNESTQTNNTVNSIVRSLMPALDTKRLEPNSSEYSFSSKSSTNISNLSTRKKQKILPLLKTNSLPKSQCSLDSLQNRSNINNNDQYKEQSISPAAINLPKPRKPNPNNLINSPKESSPLSQKDAKPPHMLSKILKLIGIVLTGTGFVPLLPIAIHFPYKIIKVLHGNGGFVNNPLTLPLLQKIMAAIAADISLLLGSLVLISTGGIFGKASRWSIDPSNPKNAIDTNSLAALFASFGMLFTIFGIKSY